MQASSLQPSGPQLMIITISVEYWLTLLHHTVTLVDILFDNQLKFHYHTTQVTTKANQVLGMINKSFENLDSIVLTHLFSILV